MTIYEINKLNQDANNKVLRKPVSLMNGDYEDTLRAHKIFKIIIDDVIRNKDRDLFLYSMFGKCRMRKVGISKIKNVNQVYNINSSIGNGVFFDARTLFIDGRYPKWIEPYNCFTNTRLLILQTGLEAKILSGIAFIGKPFLHSVLLVGDKVIDFNYDLVITKDLYFALTHFEVLAELDYTKILENKKLIKGIKGVPNYVFNFAFEEVMAQEKLKQGILDEVGV